MILRCFSLGLLVAVLAPSLLRAQQERIPIYPTFPRFLASKNTLIDIDGPNRDKMYEDIEIMRHILDRKLEPLFPKHNYQTFGMAGMGGMGGMPPGMPGMHSSWGSGMRGMQSGLGMAGGMVPASFSIRSLEGVYLKGQGVVYTATLASLQPPAKAEVDSSVTRIYMTELIQRDSEWERARRQVRNEKEKPKKPEAAKPPSLNDVLLKVLAENGHNFSQLGDNESLTLVLTVHEGNPSSPARKSGGGGKGGSAKTKSKTDFFSGDSDLRSQVRDLELLIDLHLKQGKHEDAILQLHKALELTQNPKQMAVLRRKLAQCYLMAGQDEKARAELDQAIELTKKEKGEGQ